jgi:hypothetical protein
MHRTPTERFGAGAELDGVDCSLSRAQYERLKAEQWKIEQELESVPLRKYRTLADLEGLQRYLERKLGGEVSTGPGIRGSEAIRRYRREILEVQTEIQWRRLNPNKDPLTRKARAGSESAECIPRPEPRPRRVSPGRPRRVQVNLRRAENASQFNAVKARK